MKFCYNECHCGCGGTIGFRWEHAVEACQCQSCLDAVLRFLSVCVCVVWVIHYRQPRTRRRQNRKEEISWLQFRCTVLPTPTPQWAWYVDGTNMRVYTLVMSGLACRRPLALVHCTLQELHINYTLMSCRGRNWTTPRCQSVLRCGEACHHGMWITDTFGQEF